MPSELTVNCRRRDEGQDRIREEDGKQRRKPEKIRLGMTQAQDPHYQHQGFSECDISQKFTGNSELYISDRVVNQTADGGIFPAFLAE